MQLAVYDAETSDNQLPAGTPWCETQSVTVTNGVFNVWLGSVTALPAMTLHGARAPLDGRKVDPHKSARAVRGGS